MLMTDAAFWKTKPLTALNHSEWESLCDGCGKCCVLKLEDEDTGCVHYTDVACTLLDGAHCRCKDYENRKIRVPDCIRLTPETLEQLPWMPETCAYRLIYEGKDLPPWHPLITGDADSTHKAGQSVAGKVVSEDDIDEEALPSRIKIW